MKIAIVGIGDVGSALAPLFVEAGHQVTLASRRSAEQLAEDGLSGVLEDSNVTVAPVQGAALGADIVLLAVPYVVAEATLRELGDLTGRIVIDATNFNRGRDGDDLDPGPAGTTAVLGRAFPEARWVKSFNMLWAGWLRSDAKPGGVADRVIFLAADDSSAKESVAALIRDSGFVPFETGRLADASDRQLEGTPAWNQRLTVEQAAALLPGSPGLLA